MRAVTIHIVCLCVCVCAVPALRHKTVAFLTCVATASPIHTFHLVRAACVLDPGLAGMEQPASSATRVAPLSVDTRGLPGLTFALQALLARHEALMASAETERFEMQQRIDQLETDKRSLEAENARTIQENRALLDQLEALNNCVADSETQIKSLEANLQSTQQAIRKLEVAESRATDLESQAHVLETEQAELQNTLVVTQAEARSAMQRWRKAERGISDLQEKLERIEREAREERERHTDMVNRMEKQHAMEKDLNTAAVRLKGAAAAKTIGDGKNGGVVSHFVRDLLSDNANLQLGIAELREMLMDSNDEIQHLREQLMFHSPADEGEVSGTSTLRVELGSEELDPKTPRSPRSPQRPEPITSLSQELHIHHHYHVTRPAEPKKPLKKKRQGLGQNLFAAPRPFSPSDQASAVQWRLEHRATSPAFVAHSVKDSTSTIPSTRWSVFSDQPSDFAPSSVPSSPMSHHRRRSVFDRDDYESPASPTTSVDPVSPIWTKKHRSQNSDASRRKFSTPRPLYLGEVPEDVPNGDLLACPRNQRTPRHAENRRSITVGFDHTPELTATSPDVFSTDGTPSMPRTPSFDDTFTGSPRPRLHRAPSQESIMSLTGGLDIHTLSCRPNQLALRPLGTVSANTAVQTVVARPTIARGSTEGKRGSVVLRDNLLSLPNLRAASAGATTTAPSATPPDGTPASQPRVASTGGGGGGGLGRLVSWRLWGSKDANRANTAAVEELESGTSTPSPSEGGNESFSPYPASSTTESPGSSIIMEVAQAAGMETPTRDPPPKKKSPPPPPPPPKEMAFSPPRSFGINQSGAIPGFSAFWVAHQQRGPPTQVVPERVDTEALREVLEELPGL